MVDSIFLRWPSTVVGDRSSVTSPSSSSDPKVPAPPPCLAPCDFGDQASPNPPRVSHTLAGGAAQLADMPCGRIAADMYSHLEHSRDLLADSFIGHGPIVDGTLL